MNSRLGDQPLFRRNGKLTGRAAGVLGLIAAAFLGTGLWDAIRSPGRAIRSELAAAAADVQQLPANLPEDQLRRDLQQHFLGRTVTVDPEGYPARVAVTIHGLDQSACIDAATVARRIEGLAVIELEGYHSPNECSGRNDMSWQILL